MEYSPTTPEDKRDLLSKIMSPDNKAKGYDDILDAQMAWDKVVRRYHKMLKPEEPKLGEDALITGYTSLLPEKLAENIRALPADFTNLADLKKYVRRQATKHAKPGGKILSMEESTKDEEKGNQECGGGGNDEWDWTKDQTDQLASMAKGKGNGKGYKGYQFQGNCGFCGEQ